MPLPSNPSRDQIYNELISSNYTGGNNLKEMHNYVFGSGLYSRDAFGGMGAPTLQTLSSSNIGYDSATLGVQVDPNKVNTTVFFEYSTDAFFNDTVYDSGITAESGNGYRTATINISGLTHETVYWFRGVAYNLFNNGLDSDYTRLEKASFETTALPSLNTPNTMTIDTAYLNGFRCSWNHDGKIADSFTFRYRINNGAWSQQDYTVSNKSNWGTSNNPKEADIGFLSQPQTGDTYDIEVLAITNDPDYQNSSWSNTASYTF